MYWAQQSTLFVVEAEIAGPPLDLPWLTEDPLFGKVGPDLCEHIDMTFNATSIDLRSYTDA
jgi:hypothetical protein